MGKKLSYYFHIHIHSKYITFVIPVRQPSTCQRVGLHIFEFHLIFWYMSACRHVGMALSIIDNKLCALDGMSASSYEHLNGEPLYTCHYVDTSACQHSSTFYSIMRISASVHRHCENKSCQAIQYTNFYTLELIKYYHYWHTYKYAMNYLLYTWFTTHVSKGNCEVFSVVEYIMPLGELYRYC